MSTQSEVFFGWTQAELETLLADMKEQIKVEGLDCVTTASLNGKTASLGRRMTLRDWVVYIREALQELDPITYGAPVRVSYFSLGYSGYMHK